MTKQSSSRGCPWHQASWLASSRKASGWLALRSPVSPCLSFNKWDIKIWSVALPNRCPASTSSVCCGVSPSIHFSEWSQEHSAGRISFWRKQAALPPLCNRNESSPCAWLPFISPDGKEGKGTFLRKDGDEEHVSIQTYTQPGTAGHSGTAAAGRDLHKWALSPVKICVVHRNRRTWNSSAAT